MMTTGAVPIALVMSLRPRFATAILEGRKSVELRRRRVAAPPGSHLILYASHPIMAVLGTAWLARVETGSASEIWGLYSDRLSLSKHEFDRYLRGAERASALMLADPCPLPTPLTLAALRAGIRFQPPQSYRYLSSSDPEQLRILRSREHPVLTARSPDPYDGNSL